MDKCDDKDWLLLKPKAPLPSQCCASGCKPCVFDIYERELEKWNRARAKGDIDLLTGKREAPMKSDDALINPECFSAFQSLKKLTEAVSLDRFRVPNGGSLRLSLGQHPVLSQSQLYEDGLMSQYIKTWKVGDVIDWCRPLGEFPYKPNKEETLENLPWSSREKTHLGRLNLEVMKTLVNSCRKAPFALICGSVTFNQDVLNYLRSAGLDEDSCFMF